MVSDSEMGQSFDVILGGVHWSRGQTKGQLSNTGRMGVVRTKVWGVGPTGVTTNHHQSWVGGIWSECTGYWVALQSTFSSCTVTKKNSQKCEKYRDHKFYW